MTRSVIYSSEALQQLADLYLWIATESGFSERAKRYVAAITEYCEVR